MKVAELLVEASLADKLLPLLKKEFHDRELSIHFIMGGIAAQLLKSNEEEAGRARVVAKKAKIKAEIGFEPKTGKTTIFVKNSGR